MLWCSQPSILPATNITQQIFLFDSRAWKHAYAQIVLTAIIIRLNKKYFLFCVWSWKENIQCILTVKLKAPQIFFFDWQAWKHDSSQIVIIAIIKCLNEKHFLFRGSSWKCFVVYITSHKCTANIFVWWSGLKTRFCGDYWSQQELT